MDCVVGLFKKETPYDHYSIFDDNKDTQLWPNEGFEQTLSGKMNAVKKKFFA